MPGTRGAVEALIEKQMRNRQLRGEQCARAFDRPAEPKTLKFFLSISRDVGCGAEQIAERIAAETGFQKVDRDMLDYIVANDDVRRKMYETLDDQTITWIEQVCETLVAGPAVDEAEYFNHLCRVLFAICHHCHTIVIGRGGNMILPREYGLAVRLVAASDHRLFRYARRMKVDLTTARIDMERITQQRGRFIEDHFGKYAYDPRRYDLVLNVTGMSDDGVVNLILASLRAKAGDRLTLPGEGATE